jgi:hypothetical protein
MDVGEFENKLLRKKMFRRKQEEVADKPRELHADALNNFCSSTKYLGR